MIKSHSTLVSFLLVFLPSFFIYAFTISFAPTGFADADELTVAAYLLSVPHPPGYPLYTVLLGFMMRLFSVLEPSAVANLFSALSISAALGIMAAGIYRVISTFKPESNQSLSKITAVITGSLVMAFTAPLWLFSGRAEVFGFALLLIAAVLYFGYSLLIATDNSKNLKWYLYSLVFLIGVSLSHLQTVILILPGLLLILGFSFPKLRLARLLSLKSVFLCLLILILGYILPNLFLLYLNSRAQDFSWYFSPTLKGWINHILRRDYSGFFAEEGTSRSAYLVSPTLSSLKYLFPYYSLVIQNLGIVVFSLFVFGLLVCFRLNKQFALTNLAMYLFTAPVFALLIGIPIIDHANYHGFLELAVLQKQHLIGYLTMIPSIVVSLWFIFSKIVNYKYLLIIVPISLIAWTFYSNFRVGYQRNNTIVYDYAKEILKSAAPNALIICTMDIPCFALEYVTKVESLRPDVTILPKTSAYSRYLLADQPQLYPLTSLSNPNYLVNLISLNLPQKPVYLTEVTDFYLNEVGLNANPFYLIPNGYLYQIASVSAQKILTTDDYSFTQKLIQDKSKIPDYYRLGLKGYIADFHHFNQQLTNNYGEAELTKIHRNFSQNLLPLSQILTQAYLQSPAQEPVAAYAPLNGVNIKQIDQQYHEALKRSDYQTAYSQLIFLIRLKPYVPEYRQLLINLLIQGNHDVEANQEIDNFQRLFPDLHLDLKKSEE